MGEGERREVRMNIGRGGKRRTGEGIGGKSEVGRIGGRNGNIEQGGTGEVITWGKSA